MGGISFRLVTIGLAACCLSATAGEKPKDPPDIGAIVDTVVRATIESKCHLTKYERAPVVSKGAVEIGVAFDNASLRSFWNPEVAVQYGFDAAVGPLVRAIFGDKEKRFKDVGVIRVDVHITPHDLPPRLVFEISRATWHAYEKDSGGRSKATLYRQIKVTSGGEPFRFDADQAADVE